MLYQVLSAVLASVLLGIVAGLGTRYVRRLALAVKYAGNAVAYLSEPVAKAPNGDPVTRADALNALLQREFTPKPPKTNPALLPFRKEDE